MLRDTLRNGLPGRLSFTVLGTLALGAFFLFMAPGSAQNTKIQPKAPVGKADAAPAKTINLELHKDSGSDVVGAVQLINDKLAKGWEANKVTPSRQATDAEFLRRASLDIVGRIAKVSEVEQFYKDPQSTRRSLLIDRLLADEDYARHWANMWANWLLGRSGAFGKGKYHEGMNVWLEDQFAIGLSYDKMVTKLLTATGKNDTSKDKDEKVNKDAGAVNYILAHLGEEVRNTPQDKDRVSREGHFEMVPITSRTTRLFLGTQVQCAQCHDHPFLGNVKQNQFWGINAFFRQVNRKGAPAMAMRNMTSPPLELVDDTSVNPRPLAYYEKRNGVILRQRAEFLPPGPGKQPTELDETMQGVQRREYLARYLIGHENFPKAIVNRMWGTFFGKGFVNPIDDFNDQNVPSNPELLNELAAQFKHYDYDSKKLIRWICNSNAYNLSCVANKTNEEQAKETLFSRMLMKSMTPEQLFESLMLATNSEAAESKAGKKELKEKWLESLISNFGDDEGNEVNFNGTVVQALMMMNGKEINEAISRKDKGTVDNAIKTSRNPNEVIGKLFLATLNRAPNQREMTQIHECFPLVNAQARSKDIANNRYYDLFWALLNCNEFLLNH